MHRIQRQTALKQQVEKYCVSVFAAVRERKNFPFWCLFAVCSSLK